MEIVEIINAGALVAAVALFVLGKIRSTSVVDKEIERIMQHGNDQMHALGKQILDGMGEAFEKAFLKALKEFKDGEEK